jgi:hypothetical protein
MATARVIADVQKVTPPGNAIEVVAIGHQFWWEYRYPALNVVTANELHVPVSDPEHPVGLRNLHLSRLSSRHLNPDTLTAGHGPSASGAKHSEQGYSPAAGSSGDGGSLIMETEPTRAEQEIIESQQNHLRRQRLWVFLFNFNDLLWS